MFAKRKVFKIPEILINNVKYKGSWYGKFILDAICSGFIEDQSACHAAKQATQDNSSGGIGMFALIVITVAITVTMVVILYCYKRVVHRSLEQTLNEKIQQQAIFSLGQYSVFKDDTGRRTVDTTKL
jgi:hypothetical protein